MQVLVVVLSLVACALASRLITEDEIGSLFVKFVRNETTLEDEHTFADVLELLHHPTTVSRELLEFSTQSRDTLDCILCRSAFRSLFAGVQDGQTDKQLTESLTVLCYALGIETFNVCHGAVRLNIPVLTHIIRTTPPATPNAFCSLIQQKNEDNRICPLQDERFEWQVDLPDPVDTVQRPSSDNTFRIALITDAHLDPLYQPGSVADCDEPTCCRPGQKPRMRNTYDDDQELVEGSVVVKDGVTSLDLDAAANLREGRKSSTTYSSASPLAGYWGDYRNCDTPVWAFDNTIDEIAEKHRDVELVYYIGDSIDHHVWETEYQLIEEMNNHVVDKIREKFGDDVRVVPAIGNHESQPTNQFAPSSVSGPYVNTSWLYSSLARKWRHYLPEAALQSLRERGAFSLLVAPRLRVISINNNIAYRYNWWLVYDPLEARRHLQWLVAELLRAETAGERVHILAHIPAGVNDLTHVWTREYNRIVNRFSGTISAELNGHTHSDEFKLFYSSEDVPAVVAWNGGGVNTYSDYNMNYKILSVDREAYSIIDIQTYVYNLTEANLSPHRNPHWFQLYDFRQLYSVSDLTPASIDNLLHRMVTTDKQLLDFHAAFFHKLSDARPLHNNSELKLNDLCKAVVTVLWERERCDELKRLYNST